MRIRYLGKLALWFFFGLILAAPAQALRWNDIEEIDFSGYVDVYSALNLNHPGALGIPLHVFEGADGSLGALNRAELVFDHPRFRLDLGYGPTDAVTNGGLGTSTVNVQQFYVKWPLQWMDRTVALDAGKFVTHMGFEVIESKDNWLYSRGLLFQFAIPYWHAGVRATAPLNENWWGHIAAVNGWNELTAQKHRKPSWCFQLGGKWAPMLPTLTTVVNVITGPDAIAGTGSSATRAVLAGGVGGDASSNATVYDLVAILDVNDQWSLGANYDSGSTSAPGVSNGSYNGLALYAKYAFPEGMLPMDGTSLKVRYENVNDNDLVLFGSGFTGIPTGLTVSSVTVGYDLPIQQDTLARLEYRTDSSNQALFPTNTGTGQFQSAITAALVATF